MKTADQLYTLAEAHARALCGLTPSEYRNAHTEAATDARIMVVAWMTTYGHTEATLQRVTGWSQQRVNYLHNAAATRLMRRVYAERYAELSRLMDEA